MYNLVTVAAKDPVIQARISFHDLFIHHARLLKFPFGLDFQGITIVRDADRKGRSPTYHDT